ncbi:MAG: ferrochelatase [Terriglobales bacterium]
MQYDAIVLVSFGGPEKLEDVLPFLENVLRGRNVPAQRRQEIAGHYCAMGGRSPIVAATQAMAESLQKELDLKGPRLPVYIGNRNWHPMLEATLRKMAQAGIGRALAVVTSAFGSYSGCQQYREDIERARGRVAAALGKAAPEVDKIRLFYNHPEFLAIWMERVQAALAQVPEGSEIIFTAHSIPETMAAVTPYVEQLQEAARLIATAIGHAQYHLAYQSRSGRPEDPWLEPSVESVLGECAARAVPGVVVAPLGFLSDHMEVVYDLDREAQQKADELGLPMVRVKTPGDHPAFAGLLHELILERCDPERARRAVGRCGAWADDCYAGCCLTEKPFVAGIPRSVLSVGGR